MLTEKDYCDYDTCVALKELGYNEGSVYTYCNHCRVSDEMLEKHPGLSDSGYMDLTDAYGGPYKVDEVYKHYIEPLKRFSRNSMIDNEMDELCSCIHLYEVQKWLRKEKFLLIVVNRLLHGEYVFSIVDILNYSEEKTVQLILTKKHSWKGCVKPLNY